ncbi:hypothetical protein JCGZ_17147 [Jatropha curcas]|uniref:Uncharacterized protein n=1 Tax=Jatropha curcas TaxID=180498 RepID=A0A067K2E5_JATCU|nr:hypothetical protein JCGZ_17147 [Jatropha curcas]
MEEGNPPPFGSSFGAGTFGASPSFQGASSMSNDEVLPRMMSRMDIFDTRLNGMESMIADRFQSIEIMHGSLDSRMDTLQVQLQTVIQLLQPHPPPPPVNTQILRLEKPIFLDYGQSDRTKGHFGKSPKICQYGT